MNNRATVDFPGAAEFPYIGGKLHGEAVPLADMAAEIGTPFYCYSRAGMEARYGEFTGALAGLKATACYSLKANANLAVVRTFAALGAGADVVSEGELRRALAAGIPPHRIVFSGVGKTRDELAYAVGQNILQINIESAAELDLLAEVARQAGRTARAAIRVNPDVDANTHEKIATGRKEDKFGVDSTLARELYASAAARAEIDMVGLAVHIGSQLTDLAPFRAAFRHLKELASALEAEGLKVRRLDLGGGLGITYDDETPPGMTEYGELVREELGALGRALLFEPGRALVGNAGVLVTSVLYVKQGASRRFVIVDAAMNDLPRPALYDAYHAIVPAAAPAADAEWAPADVVGPICESGDIFASGRSLPPLAPGDLLAICSAGAYGAAMASTYNSRPTAAQVMVDDGRFAIVCPRLDRETMMARDRIPDWLPAPPDEASDEDDGDSDTAALRARGAA